MTTASEGRIDIGLCQRVHARYGRVRIVEQCVCSLAQQYGRVVPWCVHRRPSEREVLEDVRHLALHGFGLQRVVGIFVPQLEMVAHAKQHRVF